MEHQYANQKDMPMCNGTELPDFEDYESRLKGWLWIHGKQSSYTAESNPQLAAMWMPAINIANQPLIKEHQMFLFQCLTHAFKTRHSEILRQEQSSILVQPLNIYSFASTAFMRIRALYNTQSFATAKCEVSKLQELYDSFRGEPKSYFETINEQVFRVSEYRPGYVQPVVNVYNGICSGILQFGMAPTASPPDATWSTWVIQLQARMPANLMTVANLETEANTHYSVYQNVKQDYARLSGKKSEMGAFITWGNDRRDDRRDC